MMCVSALVDALRILKRDANTKSVLRLCSKVIVRILTVMMQLSFTGELVLIAGKSELGKLL